MDTTSSGARRDLDREPTRAAAGADAERILAHYRRALAEAKLDAALGQGRR